MEGRWVVRTGALARRTSIIVAACLSATTLLGLAPASTVAWSSPTVISEPAHAAAWYGAIAGSGSHLHVVYGERVEFEEGRYGSGYELTRAREVRVRSSTDGGTTFSPAVLLSDPAVIDNEWASVAASGSSAYVVWRTGPDGGPQQVWLRRSLDGGATWSPARSVTALPSEVGVPGVFATADRVFITWTNAASHDVLLIRSRDRGGTFSTPTALGKSFIVQRPTMAFGTQSVYFAWESARGTIRLRRSTTGGVTWRPATTVQSLKTAYPTFAALPSLAASRHSVLITSTTLSPGSRVAVRISRDDGRTWSPPRTLGSPPTWGSMAIRSAGRWWLTYRGCSDGTDCEILPVYVRSTADGVSWTTPRRLSGGIDINVGIARTVANGRVWAAILTSDWECDYQCPTVVVRSGP